jgi:hypothetical protein
MTAVDRIAIATLIVDPAGVERTARLARTWRAAADAAATAPIVAVAMDALGTDAAARLAADGVAVHTAAGDWRPVLAAALPASVDQVLLLASETVVVGDPRPWLAAGCVHALPRSEPALSAARCRGVERHFSLGPGTFRQYEPSVLAAPPALLGTFLRRWMELARALAAAPAVLGDEAPWREVVAFSLAVASCDERRVDLPVEMGLAAHTAPRDDQQLLIDPVIVRGGESDATGALAYSPYPFAQARLARVNRRLTIGAPVPEPVQVATGAAPAQVVVLGMHRSGTSALAGALALTGLYAGRDEDFPFADAANPRGYWEHLDVWAIDEALVRMVGRRWHDVTTSDLDRVPEAARAELGARARRLVGALDAHGPWMVKDPRHCLLLPFWLPLLSHPVAIVVYRDPLAVARSVAARDGFTLVDGLALWERYNAGALAVSAAIPRVVVAQRDLVERPVAILECLVAALTRAGVGGLFVPDPEQVQASIDPSMVHHAREGGAPGPQLTRAQADVLAALERERIRESAA